MNIKPIMFWLNDYQQLISDGDMVEIEYIKRTTNRLNKIKVKVTGLDFDRIYIRKESCYAGVSKSTNSSIHITDIKSITKI